MCEFCDVTGGKGVVVTEDDEEAGEVCGVCLQSMPRGDVKNLCAVCGVDAEVSIYTPEISYQREDGRENVSGGRLVTELCKEHFDEQKPDEADCD